MKQTKITACNAWIAKMSPNEKVVADYKMKLEKVELDERNEKQFLEAIGSKSGLDTDSAGNIIALNNLST